MKQIWFRRPRWMFVPIHPAGFIAILLAMIFTVPVCMAVVRNGHSVNDDRYEMFVYGNCTAFWWQWVAEKTSEKQ